MPHRLEEFTHRNGRTARMNADGTSYILQWEKEELPFYIQDIDNHELGEAVKIPASKWKTLFISGGRKDKISKGDIAGLFMKQGGLGKEELGLIEIKEECSFVAVSSKKAHKLIEQLNDTRVKKRKVRIKLA